MDLSATQLIAYVPPLAMLVGWVIILARQCRARQVNGWRLAVLAALAVYVQNVIVLTLWPEPVGVSAGPRVIIALSLRDLLNWQPRQLLGNLVLLAPLAVIAPLLWPHLAHLRRVLVLCLLTSLTIECLQVVLTALDLARRSFDLNDLLLNTAGGLLGYAAFALVRRWRPDWVDRLNPAA
ncbi:VanZ family protein [Lacticaseibacillus absianus]|uniref:VanZ family protein n=1 Tax=Lacticaseibacillus absianus TaxID=2729623 RepID=UPI0015CC2B6D|nr:VanZ family protein [Lacticaseibacillus absianus]